MFTTDILLVTGTISEQATSKLSAQQSVPVYHKMILSLRVSSSSRSPSKYIIRFGELKEKIVHLVDTALIITGRHSLNWCWLSVQNPLLRWKFRLDLSGTHWEGLSLPVPHPSILIGCFTSGNNDIGFTASESLNSKRRSMLTVIALDGTYAVLAFHASLVSSERVLAI
jgi:hypothetical protein